MLDNQKQPQPIANASSDLNPLFLDYKKIFIYIIQHKIHIQEDQAISSFRTFHWVCLDKGYHTTLMN